MKKERLRDTDPADTKRVGRATKPKLAATLILLRQSKGQVEFLMGRRSERHKFMPGKFVFPGGRVDRADFRAPASSALQPEVLAKMSNHISRAKIIALAAAAIRETCEETGLKLAQPAKLALKQTIPASYQAFCQKQLAPDLSALSLLARAITPPYHPKRYDTWFFSAATDTLLDDPADMASGELEDLQWLDFSQSTKLDLPLITQMVLNDLAEKLKNPAAKTPYYFSRYGKHIRSQL